MPNPDFQEMLDAGLPFVKRMLTEFGEFIPFGVRVPNTGRAELLAGDVGVEHPRSADVMALLEETFKRSAAKRAIRSGAICFMGRVSRPSSDSPVDAAIFRMAHVDGDMLEVFLPYTTSRRGAVSFGDIFASKGAAFKLSALQ
jgi:hypothetical protein